MDSGNNRIDHKMEFVRDKAGKGEIMKRLHNGMRMGVQYLFALALVFLMGNTASAQFQFMDIELDFYAAGQVNTTAISSVSAILAATDAETSGGLNSQRIAGTNKDGDVVDSSFQLDDFMSAGRGIIANIEGPTAEGAGDGESLVLIAGVQNVTSSVVASIRAGDANAATNQQIIFDNVKATLNSDLFGIDVSSSVYTAISPNYVTGIGTDTHGLPVMANSSTAVVVAWYIPTWVVSATQVNGDPTPANTASIDDMSATVYFTGQTPGPNYSNLVGVETVIAGAQSGPSLSYTILGSDGSTGPLRLVDATDTISAHIADAANPFPTTTANTTSIASHITLSTAVATEYRTTDVLAFQTAYDSNEENDGEPNAYFGGNSDLIILNATGTTEGARFGGRLSFTAQLSTGSQDLFPASAFDTQSDLNQLLRFVNDAQGGVERINVIGMVRPALRRLTVGQFTAADVSFTVADDINNATNFTLESGLRPRIDTVPPVVTEIVSNTENDLGLSGRKKLTGNALNSTLTNQGAGAYDEFKVGINVSGDGESLTGSNFQSWLKASFATSDIHPVTATSTADNTAWGISNTNSAAVGSSLTASASSIALASQVNIFPDITGTNITGVSMTVNMAVLEPISSFRSAGIVFQVSDDARNPALSEASGTLDAFSDIAISGGTYYFNTGLINKVTRQTTVVQSKDISAATFALDNTGPTIVSATAYFDGLPSGYFGDSSLATSKLLGTLNRLQQLASNFDGVPGTVNSASSFASAAELADVTLQGVPASLLANSTQFVRSTTGGNGSPIEVVIAFSPIPLVDATSSYSAGHTNSASQVLLGSAETDGLPGAGGTSAFNTLFNAFIKTPASVSDAFRPQFDSGTTLDVPSGWTVEAGGVFDASTELAISGNSVIGFATIRLSAVSTVALASDAGDTFAQFRFGMADTLGNVGEIAALPNSSTTVLANSLTFDASAPIISGASDPANITFNNSLVFGDGSVISGVAKPYAGITFLVTDSRNSTNTTGVNPSGFFATSVEPTAASSFLQLASSSGSFANTIANTSQVWVNGIANTSVGSNLTLQAGYWMIVSATFVANGEIFETTGVSPAVADIGGFPYGFGQVTDNFSVTGGATDDYGTLFRVISADFSDFVSTAKDVLPTASAVIYPGISAGIDDISEATAESVIAATWVYFIDSSQTLNSALGTDVRSVTLRSKDLYGSVREVGFPAGSLDNTQPTISVLSYKITNTFRATDTVVVQSQTETADAFSISHATGSSLASYELVVRVANGSQSGGMDAVAPIRANLTNFTGNASQAPSTPNTATIAAASLIDVTFSFSQTATVADENAASAITLTAIRDTGTQATANTTAIQVDSTAPSFVVTPVLHEGGSVIVNGITLTEDSATDGILRPGQTVIVDATVQLAGYESGDTVIGGLTATSDFNEFNSTDLLLAFNSRTVVAGSPNRFVYRWNYTIPTNTTAVLAGALVRVTDVVGNMVNNTIAQQLVESNEPRVESLEMAISKQIARASGQYDASLIGSFVDYASRTTTGGLSVAPSFPAAGVDDATGAVAVGDTIRIVASVLPNDPVFTDPDDFNLTADFSQFGGGTSVAPKEKAPSGALIEATWEFTVAEGAANSTEALVTLSVSDPAGLTASGVTTSPTIAYVSQAYDLSSLASTQLYSSQGGAVQFTGASAGQTIHTITQATYSLVVTVNFDQFALDGDQFTQNRPGNVIAAEIDRINTAGTAPYLAAAQGLVGLIDSNFQGNTNFQAIGADQLTIHDGQAGGSKLDVFLSTTAPTIQTSDALRTFHGTLLTATFGIPGTGKNLATANSVASASLLLVVTDTIGNDTYQSFQSFKLDGAAPTVSNLSLVLNATNSAPGSWLPAIYAGSTPVRPTRVINGAVLDYSFELLEVPGGATLTATDVISAQLNTTDFNVVTANVTGITGEVTVTGSFTVGTGNSTYPISQNPANFDSSPSSLQLFPATAFARVEVKGFDGVNNSAAALSSQPFEVDLEGPKPLIKQSATDSTQTTILALTSLSAVNALDATSSILNSTPSINVVPNGYLVWAGTVVVDGTDDIHFASINVDYQEAFEQDIQRFDPASLVTGSKVIGPQSATRSLRFVTWAIQAFPDANPAAVNNLQITFADSFGNTETVETGFIGLNAEGPGTLEVSLTIDGVEQSAGASSLGIGNAGDDRTTPAVFEVGPGSTVKVTAFITSVTGVAPAKVTADFSDLYSSVFSNEMSALLPSSLTTNDDDQIVAVWENVIYDYSGLLTPSAGAGFPGALGTFPTSNFNLIPSANILTSASFSVFTSNGTVSPAQNIFLGASNGVSVGSATVGNMTSVISADYFNFSQSQADSLIGLPYITVQNDPAIAKPVAAITLVVDATDDLFDETSSTSIGFTLDSKAPTGTWSLDPNKIVRELPAVELVTDPASPRIGFPTAASLTSNTAVRPNRLRGGDVATFLVELENELISGDGNDDFVPNGGTSANRFDIDETGGLEQLQVAADLSSFASGMTSLIADTAGTNGYILSVSPRNNDSDLISATYTVMISKDLGTTASGSRLSREVTGTITDDAGNVPVNNFWSSSIFNRDSGTAHLGIDNRAPLISGNLEVVLESGSATLGDQTFNPGDQLDDSARINAASILAITVTVTDSTDNPLDVLVNRNYGEPEMVGQNLPDVSIILQSDDALLIGNDNLSVPFRATLPGAGVGRSTRDFSFVISATDTLGNSRLVESLNSFGFDGAPFVQIARDGVVTTESSILANAGSSLVLDATSLDLGGITSIAWLISPTTLDGVSISTENGVFVKEVTPSVEEIGYLLTITPEIGTQVGTITAFATASDIDGFQSSSNAVAITINQPALFTDADVIASVTNISGVVESATIPVGVAGLNAAGEDIREVTISEGQTLLATIPATDPAGSAVTVSATGSALFSSAIESATYEPTTGLFRFAPGFKAVTSASSEVFQLDLSATDGTSIGSDNSTLLVNVVAQSATPELSITSVSVDGVAVSSDPNVTVSVPENQELVIALSAQDTGNETLAFSVETSNEGVDFNTNVTGSSTLSATVTYTPTLVDADSPNQDSLFDPFFFIFKAANSSITAELNKPVDIVNVSQAPTIASVVSVNGGAAASISNGGTVNVEAGDSLVFTFTIEDPDGDSLTFPSGVAIGDIIGSQNFSFNVTSLSEATANLSADIIAGATPGTTASVIISATDGSAASRNTTHTFTIAIATEVIPPVTPAAEIDEIVIAQGFGGTAEQQTRNVDTTGTEPLLGLLNTLSAMPGQFEPRVGGGLDRNVYLSIGDVNNDGQADIVNTFGPITSSATFPNMFIVRDGRTRAVVGSPLSLFPHTNPATFINLTSGEMRSAVGNFTGSATNQIALAAGFGSDRGTVRIVELDASEPNGWRIVAQFSGLSDAPVNNPAKGANTANANGGVTLAAGDVDGDGFDELIVGQTNSATSDTSFQIVDIDGVAGSVNGIIVDADVTYTFNLRAFGNVRNGEGGVNLAVADLTGDGMPEIIATSLGHSAPTLTGNPVSVFHPVVTDGTVTDLVRPGGIAIFNAFTDAENPSSSVSVGAGEFNGSADGSELVFGTGAILGYDAENTEVTVASAAPLDKYIVLKPVYNDAGDTIESVINVIDPNRALGRDAFLDYEVDGSIVDNDPSSGAISVAGGNTFASN